MARIHLIPGAVTRRSVKALVLTDARQAPAVSVRSAGGGDASGAAVAVRTLVPSPMLEPHLRGVTLHVATISGLAPGRCYVVTASAGGAESHGRFRTPGDADPLKVVVASCYYDAKGAADAYLYALTRPPAAGADFKLLVGDNVYLDVYDRDFEDPWKDTAELYLRHFWDEDRRYKDVLASCPTIVTWDDHEFWNNYPHEQVWIKNSKDERRRPTVEAARECLALFQASLNPDPPPGVRDRSYVVDDLPQASFFVADTRTEREKAAGYESRMMPEAALKRLEAWAAGLDRPGVLVLGQPLWMSQGSGFDFNPPRFALQYDRIWAALAGAAFDMLVVSGDIHHSRLLALDLDGDRRVYELISSPARHIPIGAGEVGFPNKAPYELVPGFPRLRPGDPYLFGTDVEGTIGVLDLAPAGGGAVDAGVHFLDLDRGGAPAKSVPANVRDGPPYRWPKIDPCTASRAFTLARRPEAP